MRARTISSAARGLRADQCSSVEAFACLSTMTRCANSALRCKTGKQTRPGTARLSESQTDQCFERYEHPEPRCGRCDIAEAEGCHSHERKVHASYKAPLATPELRTQPGTRSANAASTGAHRMPAVRPRGNNRDECCGPARSTIDGRRRAISRNTRHPPLRVRRSATASGRIKQRVEHVALSG